MYINYQTVVIARYMPCSALAEDYSPQLAPTQVRPRKEHEDVAFLATGLG